MKYIESLLISAICFIFMGGIVSCTTQEPDIPGLGDINQINGGQTSNDTNPSNGSSAEEDNSTSMQNLVQQHVKVSASYSNYTWHFHIESTLHQALPNETITYGIGHGDVHGITSVSIEAEAYSYSSSMSNGKKIMDFTNPVFFYWAFGLGSLESNSTSTFCTALMYMASLNALDNKISSAELPLTNDEWALYRKLQDWLNTHEKKANKNYHPTIHAIIGNKFYIVATYSR
ncbi:MAG: hypothetical protein HDS26_04120 [Bacteroides sp.]|nr:hypothetical protein [Bacteroides sp.]